MALVVKDRVRETSTTTGTGTFTLAGAVTGYQSFSAIGNANTTYYTIYLQGGNEWEVGIGTYTASGTTLSRDTILASSNGGSAVNFSAGVKDVFVTYPAGRSVYYDTATNVTLNALTLSGGTANGVLYLNGSKVATSGSALTFDGTTVGIQISGRALNIGTTLAANFYSAYRYNNADIAYIGNGPAVIAGTAATDFALSTNGAGTSMIFGVNNAEAMRLTSTGLGIGTSSPTWRLVVNAASGGGMQVENSSDSNRGGRIIATGSAGAGTFAINTTSSGYALTFGIDGTEKARLDTSGNLGLGVTPSAMNTITAMQLGYSGIIAGQQGTAEVFYLGSNWYYNSGFKYKNNGYATRYNTDSGAHSWYTAPSGTAGNAISFTQAMTLDASGNLGIGTTNPANKLHVNGAAENVHIILTNSTSGSTISDGFQLICETGTANAYILQRENAPILFWTNNTERVQITAAGTFQTSLDASIYGVTVGRGAGAVSTNTAVGASALAANTTGGNLVAIGYNALASYTSTSTTVGSVAVGNSALSATTTGTSNTAVGDRALTANTTGSANTAVGYVALAANTTGTNNTAVGRQSLTTATTAVDNTAVGFRALYLTNTGSYNVAVGREALNSNTTAANNTAVGYQAGYSNTTGTGNSIFGYQAGYSNITSSGNSYFGNQAGTSNTGSFNVAVGSAALYSSGAGGNNTALGYQSLFSNTTASNNTAVGYQAGYANNAGADNVYIGKQAGYGANTSGAYYNTFVGSEAGYGAATAEGNSAFGALSLRSITTGTNNTAIGRDALRSNNSGGANAALGFQALYSNTTASNNTAVGYQAGYALTTGQYNTALGMTAMGVGVVTGSENASVGYASLRALTSGNYNVALGAQAMLFNTVASYGTAVGYQAGYSNTTGNANTSVGAIALYTNTSGTENTALGYAALYRNTTGNYNTAVGKEALVFNTTASNNTAVGYQAAYSNTTAANNTAVGYVAGFSTTTGAENTSLGSFALYTNSTGNYNVAIGRQALNANTTASGNTAVGYQALYSNQSSPYNTAVGYQAGYSGVYAAGTFVGYQAGLNVTTAANNTFIGYLSGSTVTTGAKNTILGGYNGNQGGLDIRTANNYIVLSDGDGNPRGIFDNSGDLLVGVTSGSFHRFHKSNAGDFAVQSANTSATTPYVHVLTFTAAAPNDATSMFLRCDDTGVFGRIQLRSNGGIANYQANDVNLSDRREKTNFAPAKSYLDAICAIPVQTFNYIDQSENDPGLTLGVVAQDVQAVAPELVSESNWGTDDNPKMRLSIYQTDLQYALMKCIQEQQAMINELKAEVAALKGV